MTNTCGTCKFWQEAWPADGDDPAGGDCQFPKDRLPLSMSGFAMCEQETVYSDTANCPTWTAPGGEDIPVVEEKPASVHIAPRWLPMGTVVCGTWDLGDRLRAILNFAYEHKDIVQNAKTGWDARLTIALGYLEYGDWDDDKDQEFHDQLCEMLNTVCPPFCFFGSHPGNSSDIGVWPDDEEIEEAINDRKMVKVNHNLDIENVSPTWGYVLVMGRNGTYKELYERAKGVQGLVWKLK